MSYGRSFLLHNINDMIEFEQANNDPLSQSFNHELLIVCQDIIGNRLRNMPRDYVHALMFDTRLGFQALVIQNKGLKYHRRHKKTMGVVGCIVYRVFKKQKFAEIAFCCVTGEFHGKV